jgi:hypothetical protein
MNTPPVLKEAKQKLVTIYVDNMAYAAGKMLVGSFADKHGKLEEHLETYYSKAGGSSRFTDSEGVLML